ncbi:MAG: hypothetical protein IJM97_00140 [Clostridia bacterium]|nr:hypothetical protein [Clostridia bacterium]MBQ6707334.1 hypothetical protein [Clostridia bacterium]
MNTTDSVTYEKIMIPLRLPPELYKELIIKVTEQKMSNRGYSINQYVTNLIYEDLKKK